MANDIFPESGLPIRRTVELLPQVFRTDANKKFTSAVLDPLVQPGVLQKTVGYVGRRYGKTYNSSDVYLDTDETLRSRYQLEPGVVKISDEKIEKFYDYLDFKNQIKYFGVQEEKDNKITSQDHYTWNPPIDWDKFINYREYYWAPAGPPDVKILGQALNIVSSYRVGLGTGSVFIFSPDGFTNNPTLTLYRGQTYKFHVNVPGDGFVIRNAVDTGSILYNPLLPYKAGQITVFGGKLWKALVDISVSDGSSIDENSQDWELLEDVTESSALDYTKGITNNGIESGTITFEVPRDAPDVLFYQSFTDPNKFGRFSISNVESNTKIDVFNEVIGKSEYTSSNGITLTNGLVITFLGQVFPENYANTKWIVEGVGEKIRLVNIEDLVVPPNLTTGAPEILFDNSPFDTQPFDDATAYPYSKDYITINRSSIDKNPWSRYNRWFHRSVLDFAHEQNGTAFEATETSRAKRPIIEFIPDLSLYNHGEIAKQSVDFLDDETSDVFSLIEGAEGFIVDGELLFEGARILVITDTDSLANNRIYQVKFITHNNRRQITLIKTTDTESVLGDCVLVKRGNRNSGKMFHYNGDSWIQSQLKTKVNQSPLFDIFDKDEVSFGDQSKYQTSSFEGSSIVGYKKGTATVDSELGFALSYLNIDNVGDIEFEYQLDTQTFSYIENKSIITKTIKSGFYRTNVVHEYHNGWIRLDERFTQPIIDSIKITSNTNQVEITAIDWTQIVEDQTKILFFVNGLSIKDSYTRNESLFTFSRTFNSGDIVSVKIFSNVDPLSGYYEIPVGLEKNPLNDSIKEFTLGQASDHLYSGLELSEIFDGKYPGISNLRDISGYRSFSKRFLKHSGLTPLSIFLLCDKQKNIIKSIQFAKKTYSDFKNIFINLANDLFFDQTASDFVDTILLEYSRTKNQTVPFSGSDMVGSGAYSSIDYVVEDTGIKTFALSEKFDLETLSKKAVYVYLNDQQLLTERDYTFNSTFGFVNLLVDLQEGDSIQIREYVSTAFSFIPPTPTKLGLYKKYIPRKFVDDTYVKPVEVIQGHDGSITVSYGDFRDDVLLELENRIYNNIKQQYDETIFDVDKILGGYYGNSFYSKSDLDNIVNSEFLKWVADTNINFVDNEYFDSEDSFTYTYSNMTDQAGLVNLPGYWRGVYEWFYDTVRPHTCPWEMLGFSEKPIWWEEEYGSAPYTSNNLILWEDIRDGIIRQGTRAGTHKRYARPSILRHLPVNSDGELLSPLDSGLAGNFSLINNRGTFLFGDRGPVEYAWRSSSEWPFAVMQALSLLKPFEFIGDNFNRSRMVVNKIGQTVVESTGSFMTLDDLKFENTVDSQVSGLVIYLAEYVKNYSLTPSQIKDDLEKIDVKLSSRMSGFVDQQQQKYILDSKNPSSSSSTIFLPPENYDIIFNISSPITSISYSGIILEKTSQGWKLLGYDASTPYFNYYQPVSSTTDPLITVGGVSENFLDWTPNKFYGNGVVIRLQGSYYRSIASHTSGDDFELDNWKKLPSLPLINAVEAQRRRKFNKLIVKKVLYGTVFNNIQQVVDFILGYQEYLIDQGFVFENYDPASQVVQDWYTSAKEFMFWSKHNWSVGSLLTLSPAATNLTLNTGVGVADNILDSFYDYQVLKNDGTPISPTFIDVDRSFRSINVKTVNTNEGIYFLKLHLVLKEHVVVFDDRTIFNDVIYDKTTGYRQERIRSRGFRTIDWDGDYTSPGFLFDNVDIQNWQPFTDYKLGDIVSYKSYYWTSRFSQLGQATFDDKEWTKLDSNPTKQLVPNFDYRINQIEDYYEVDSDGLGSSQRDLARHLVGYQPREYLQNLAEDSISQFRIYQGFIREKGTANSIVKIFDKLSRSEDDSVILNEEWAFKVGELGGTDQIKTHEFNFEKGDLVLNPQPLIVEQSSTSKNKLDQYLRIGIDKFTIAETPFSKDINPKAKLKQFIRSAGYVNVKDIDLTVRDLEELYDIPVSSVKDNAHIWVIFYNWTWAVYRYNESLSYRVIATKRTTGRNELLTLNRPAENISVGDIIGISYVFNLNGFYKVVAKTSNSITVESRSDDEAVIEDSSSAVIGILTKVRLENYQQVNKENVALSAIGSKLWIDDAGSGSWEVVEKNQIYDYIKIGDYGITDPRKLGTALVYSESLRQVITSVPGSSYVMAYSDKVAPSSEFVSLQQTLPPPSGFESSVSGVFGQQLALSPDSKWLAVGTPEASGVRSKYMGELDAIDYLAGEIVLFNGKLWEAQENIYYSDGTTINFDSKDWAPAQLNPANSTGRATGFTKQGLVSLYRYQDGQWNYHSSIISPRPSPFENFGGRISISVSGTKYYMAVSAPGSLDRRGRVYLYKYDGQNWIHLEDTTKFAGTYNHGAAFQATVAGKILTITESVSGTVVPGMELTAFDVPEGTTITKVAGEPGDLTFELDFGDGDDEKFLSERMYTALVRYPAGTIVWSNGALWKALTDQVSDGDVLKVENTNWQKLDQISTQNSLPTNVAIEDDGSTLAEGLIAPDQIAELVKENDLFGYSHKMNRDGTVLIIGAPFSDSQYFTNYRGIWNEEVEYVPGDTVQYQGSYHQLVEIDVAGDSVNTSKGDRPDDGNPWVNVGDSSYNPTGKIFVYNRVNDGFRLAQTITADNLALINDSDILEEIATGDQFGYDIDIDANGTTMIVSSPQADIFKQNQGAVYVFKHNGTEFRLVQKLTSFEELTNEFFGSSIAISAATEKIVVGAKNSPYYLFTGFETGVSFDKGRTTFSDPRGFPGQVYVYDRKDQGYFLTEKLEADFITGESFGRSVDCTKSTIVVGSPNFKVDDIEAGMIRVFRTNGNESLTVIRQEEDLIDIAKLKNIELYDTDNNIRIADLDIVDPYKLKVLGLAEQELNYKTVYDPATFQLGLEEHTVDERLAWYEKHVGEVWWDLSTAKFINYEQDDIAYRVGHWGELAYGSSIDVYEWVESVLTPAEWSAVADTAEGLSIGISGQPKYPANTVYNTKIFYNPNTGEEVGTKYYFWVKNKTTLPDAPTDRRYSVSAVAGFISNPVSTSQAFVAMIDADKYMLYNIENITGTDNLAVNIEWYRNISNVNLIHREYQLLTEGVADSLPAEQLERKWIDSLVGYDQSGNLVPDPELSEKSKYGLSFRPRQTIFVDRAKALKITIDNINEVLTTRPFTDTINFDNLNLKDPLPSVDLNEYDIEVDSYIDLEQVGTVRIKQATLSANIINGQIDTIDIVDPGFGYRTTPFIEIEGDGVNALASITLDNQGRVSTVRLLNRGRKYTSAVVKIRPFSVLVKTDSTADGFWGIYGWDQLRRIFYRRKSQGFDTTIYWEYTDWFEHGYSRDSRINKEIPDVNRLPALILEEDDIVYVKEYAEGGWAMLVKTADGQGDLFDNYSLIGRQGGTIRIKETLYDQLFNSLGYDGVGSYDQSLYDLQPIQELRNILNAAKYDIFVDDLRVEWNKLFFAGIKYAFSERIYVDWAFKTSFLNAIHNVGPLEQRPNYKNDNLESYQSYIEEVKPYRTSIREYTSRYTGLDPTETAITDFDLPPSYSVVDGKILPIGTGYDRFDEYPWKWWADNNGYSIVDIKVSNPGSGYKNPPTVLIEGNGSGAKAQAFITNGSVSVIRVLTSGTGYTSTPRITLVGGNGTNQDIAKAIAVLGNTAVRTFDLSVKFDRISKIGIYRDLTYDQTFIATGFSAVFLLKYPPTRDKSKISISKNDQIVLKNEYNIDLYYESVDTFTALKGKITFVSAPVSSDVIKISYEKNDELFDAVNRIGVYYSPLSGMKGNEPAQLMTGIDYGGVQIQGTTFDVTGGWDALPWYTDNWDSVESSSDFYYVADGSTTFVVLPYVPTDGQLISIYIKRNNESRATRIDDPNFGPYSPAIPAVPAAPADAEYNNGALIAENNGTVFDRALTVNGLKLVVAGAVGGQLAVPDEWAKKTARTFELMTDPNGAGINTTHQRNFLKTLRGDVGTYHAGLPTIQRVGYGGGSTYTPNWLLDVNVASYAGLQAFNDSVAQKDMVWYKNNNGNNPPTQRRDIEEIFEHVFHTVHAFGIPGAVPGSIDAVEMNPDIRISMEPSFDWQNTAIHLAMKEAIDAGLYDPSGYAPDWNTDPEKAAVAYTEYTYLVNWSMWDMSVYWDGGSLSPEWDDSLKTPAGMLANNPLGYALFNTYFAPVLSKPDFATIESIFGENDTGVSGYVVDALVGGSPAVPAVPAVGDSSLVTNLNAVMPTFIGDGSSNFIELHDYLRTYPGDTLIFRTIDSDGSVTITDVNLLDTRVSGGSLEHLSSAYTTATGMTPEEIVIDGEEFISPDQVPAPEENVPGQILESLSIKVFGTTDPGSPTIQNNVIVSDGITRFYKIGNTVLTKDSIIVYVNKIKQEQEVDYVIDFVSNEIEFLSAPELSAVIEVLSVGLGGVSLLDYQEFVSDGDTDLFLTKAVYEQTANVLVTIDGVEIDTGFINSSDFIDVQNRTMVQFGFKPEFRQVIKIVVFGASDASDSFNQSLARINRQSFTFDGSTRSFALDRFADLDRGSLQSSVLVNVNDTYLQNVDTTYLIYDGTNNNITIGVDPAEAIGSITSGDIKVYINNVLQRFVIDYTYDGNQNLINIPSSNLELDNVIKVETSTRSEYFIDGNVVSIAAGVSMSEGDTIEVVAFNEYPTADLISDEFAGGKVNYQLTRTPLDTNYIWVYKNGQRLTPERDYYVVLPQGMVYINETTLSTDLIKIVQFSNIEYKRPRAFEIFKDMLNNYHYKRYSRNNSVKLAKDLNYYDTEIEITDGSFLSEPIPTRRVPGVIIIDNERIEYFRKDGNILSQLRRGSLGTGIQEVHVAGSYVVDTGATETIPYNESQERYDFISDGSTVIIGPLDFVPIASNKSNWTRNTIPNTYFSCDTIEVFVGGRRLRKDPIDQWNETIGDISETNVETLEAEFSVDGENPSIRLTDTVPAGTRITVIRKQGRIWYERGQATASKGLSLFANNTAIAEFIGSKTTEAPE